MLGAQLALAQHASIHFTDRGHIASHEQHDEQAPKTGEICQICIFSKAFSHSLTPDTLSVPAGLHESAFEVLFAEHYIKRQASHGYLACGPPTLLS